MRFWRPFVMAGILTSCAATDSPWFLGMTVTILVIAVGVCVFGWRYFISDVRHSRRQDRQSRREERREDRPE